MKHAADRLEKEAGLSPMGAAGLVARWAAVEAPGGPTAVNPLSGAAGINQALGDRKPAGYSGMSFDQQLDYIISKDVLDASQRRSLEVLKNATTAAQAAAGASMYERAEGFSGVTDNFTNSTPVQRVFDALHKRTSAGAPASTKPKPNSNSRIDPANPARGFNGESFIGTEGFGASNDPVTHRDYPKHMSSLWNGTGGGAYPHAASLSSVAAHNPVMTSSYSNAFHVGDVHVNAPNATDSKGLADSIADALQLSLHASLADYGQA
jgi:hypothetical protein